MSSRVRGVEISIGNVLDLFVLLENPPLTENQINYIMFSSGYNGEEYEEEEDVQVEDISKIFRQRATFLGSAAVLFSPLEKTCLLLRRHVSSYSGYIKLETEKGAEFPYLSDSLRNLYKKDWIPIKPEEGSGMLITHDDSREQSISVVRYSEDDGNNGFYVGIGCFGASDRLLNEEGFVTDMGALGKVVTVVANECIRQRGHKSQSGRRYKNVVLKDPPLPIQLSL